VASTVKISYTF